MLAFFRSSSKQITWYIVWFIVITFAASLLGSSALVFMSGKPDKPADGPRAKGPTSPAGETDSKDATLDSKKAVARIKFKGQEKEVTEGDLERRLRQTEIAQGRPLPEQSRQFFMPIILNRLVDENLMIMEADAQDVDVSGEVNEQLQKIYDQIGGKDEYLRRTNQKEEDIRGLLERQVKLQTMASRAREGRAFTEAELKAYYDQHISEFKAEGAKEPKPLKEVRSEVVSVLRSQVTSADVDTYYADHKARWMLPATVRLLHLAVNPVSEKRTGASSATDAQVTAYYEANKASQFKEREKVDISHIFVNPDHPDIQAKASPSETSVQTYYKDNRDQFEEEPEAKLRQILVGGTDGAEAAQAALARLKKGELFADVAAELSDDEATKSAGGDMGWMAKSEVPEALSRVIFESEAGKITDPIRTTQGYHIVLIEELREGKVRALDEVREEITKLLRKQKAFDVAEESAAAVRKLLMADGSDFVALAKEKSHAAGSAQDGGRIGVISLGENPKDLKLLDEVGSHGFLDFAIQKGVEDLKIGAISKPVRSFKGYHLLRVEARPEAGFRPLAEVREVVVKAVEKKAREDAVEAVLSEVAKGIEGKTSEQAEGFFHQMISKHSDSADATDGGDWGKVVLDTSAKPDIPQAVRGEVVSWDGLSRRIVTAVEKLEAGEVSEPVKLSAMQHLFYVAEVFPREYQKLSEVRDDIEGILNPQVEENELKEYYEQNKSQFETKVEEGPVVSHIMLKSEDEARELIGLIRNGQKKFEEVAASDRNMDRAARSKSGKLEGAIQVAAIKDAVSKTGSGEVHAEPVKSPVGWHVLKVGVREEVAEVTFEGVKEKIRERLMETKLREVESGWIQELKNRAKIEILLEQKANPFAGMLGGLGGGA